MDTSAGPQDSTAYRESYDCSLTEGSGNTEHRARACRQSAERARKKETKKVNECKPLNFQTEMLWVGFHTLFM